MKLAFACLAIFLLFNSNSVKAQLQSTTIGDAVNQGNNCFIITPDQLNQSGGVWFNNPINFDQDFTINYQNNFGTKDDNGADGMALVFKTTSIPEIGNVGGGMGYEGIANSMIVEFDTFQNNAADIGLLGDPEFDHISIQRDGNPFHTNTIASLTAAVPISNSSSNVEDGTDHEIKIVWEASTQEFSVFFDCEFVLGLNLDIKTQIFGGDDSVFFGFVGSTGGLSNLHQVCFNSISFIDNLQLQDETICNGESITIDASIPSGASYSWSPTAGVENPNSPVTVISPSITTTYTVTILDNCGESSTEDITITVDDIVDSIFDDYPEFCEGDTIPALPTTSNNGISGSWSPEINNTQTTTYTFTPDVGECGTVATLDIIINDSITPTFDEVESICEGDSLSTLTTTSNNGLTGVWSPDLDNNQTTTYTFNPNDDCSEIVTLEIIVNVINEIILNVVLTSEPFEDIISVQLEVSGGNGDYEYRVNNGPWQLSNIFDNLENNSQYNFEARQVNTCSNIASNSLTGLTFPDFFTPNSDGINDFWNIRALRNQSDAVIYIFDRYGKLLEQINPIQIGWDGNYNGRQMPSQDYWFLVEFTDELTGNKLSYNNHFTLKR